MSLEEMGRIIARLYDRIDNTPPIIIDRSKVSVFYVRLAKTRTSIEIRPLGIINGYALLGVNIASTHLSSSETRQVLRTIAYGLKENESVEYVDLTSTSTVEAFIKGFAAGLKHADTIIVQHNDHYLVPQRTDPLLILVNNNREGRLRELVEKTIKLLDETLQPITSIREQIREAIKKLKDVIDHGRELTKTTLALR